MLNSSKVIENSGIKFGTSGARGLVVEFMPNVCAAFTHSFVDVLRKSNLVTRLALAIDNRPSSYAMAQACAAALLQVGIEPIYYGVIPTPALAYKAIHDQMPCIMVTGSHIPFDRNGLKFYRPDGEITKADEQAILAAEVSFYEVASLPALVVDPAAAEAYCERYRSLFDSDLLKNKRIGIYEHSSAGRDLYAPLFESLGADVIRIERSDDFVPIDTEAVSEADKEKARCWSKQYRLDCIFSTDGDGDRPLVANERGEWLRGDILGLLCADALAIEAVAIPISCNSVIDTCGRFVKVLHTKIGSPYVIAEFAALAKEFQRIAGFEANGGFLLGSDIDINGCRLSALPTRDALLPALMLLSAAKYINISTLVNSLPERSTHSDRIKDFPSEYSRKILAIGVAEPEHLLKCIGIDDVKVCNVDLTDGLRLFLSDNTILHLRPSGNAPELRCYVEADSLQFAEKLVSSTLNRLSSLSF